MPARVGVIDVDSAWLLGSDHDFPIGIDPDLVLLFDMGTDVLVDVPGFMCCFGAFSAVQNVCQWSRGADGVTPSDCSSQVNNTRCHVVGAGGTTSAGRLSGSMVTGGFRLNVAEVYAVSRKIGYLAIEGLSSVAMGSQSTQADNLDLVVSGLGFTPRAVIFGSGATSVGVNTLSGSSGAGALGFLVGAAAACVGHGMQDNSASENVASTHSETHAIFGSSINPGGVLTAAHLPGQIDADGFTLTHPTGSSQIPIFWIAFAGMEMALERRSSNGSAVLFNGAALGFEPVAAFGLSSMQAAAAETVASADASRAMGFASDDGSHASVFHLATDALNPTDSVTRSSISSFLMRYARTGADTFAFDERLSVPLFQADSLQYQQHVVSGDGTHRIAVLIFGVPAAGGPAYHDLSATFGAALGGGVGAGGPIRRVNGGLVQ